MSALNNTSYAKRTNPYVTKFPIHCRNVTLVETLSQPKHQDPVALFPFKVTLSRQSRGLQILIPILIKFQEKVEQCGADVTFGR